ncbi:MAG: trypsin-like serine protease [Polyangiales bacterium]
MAPETEIVAQQQALVGGQQAEQRSVDPVPSTVLVLTRNQQGGSGLCSGTLVARDTVLSAAHCLEDVPQNGVEVYFGSHLSSVPSAFVVPDQHEDPHYGGWRRSASWTIPSSYDFARKPFESDIAVIRLTEPAPSAVPVATFSLSNLEQGAWAELDAFQLAGFGANRAIAQEDGSYSYRGSSRKRFGGGQRQPHEKGSPFLWTRDPDAGTATACVGDSGGSVWAEMDGQAVLVAVIVGVTELDCSGLSTSLRLHDPVVAAFLVETLGVSLPPDASQPESGAGLGGDDTLAAAQDTQYSKDGETPVSVSACSVARGASPSSVPWLLLLTGALLLLQRRRVTAALAPQKRQ